MAKGTGEGRGRSIVKMILHIDMHDPKNKKSLQKAVNKKWNLAIIKAARVLSFRLPDLLINGGGGGMAQFRPFKSTTLWQFLHTQRAFAELGFSDVQPLDDLIKALHESIVITTTKKTPRSIVLKIIDMKIVAQFTEHPSAGEGNLRSGISWFADWIIKGVPVSDHSFVKTGAGKPRSSAIAGTRAGLMRPGGMWEFPPVFRTAVDDWLAGNISAIQQMSEAVIRKAIKRV